MVPGTGRAPLRILPEWVDAAGQTIACSDCRLTIITRVNRADG